MALLGFDRGSPSGVPDTGTQAPPFQPEDRLACLQIASDLSGLGGELTAARQLGVLAQPVWVSEPRPRPDSGRLDCYFASPPCGQRHLESSPAGATPRIVKCLDTVTARLSQHQPRAFVIELLESVRHSRHHAYLDAWLRRIASLPGTDCSQMFWGGGPRFGGNRHSKIGGSPPCIKFGCSNFGLSQLQISSRWLV